MRSVTDSWDSWIPLNVNGTGDLQGALRFYLSTETNREDGSGVQRDIKKTISFSSLPKVLHLCLKRCGYDDRAQKLDDRLAFSKALNMTGFVTAAPRSAPQSSPQPDLYSSESESEASTPLSTPPSSQSTLSQAFPSETNREYRKGKVLRRMKSEKTNKMTNKRK